jgi:hypothetical protein
MKGLTADPDFEEENEQQTFNRLLDWKTMSCLLDAAVLLLPHRLL